MTAEKLATHLRKARYGDFWLTDAIRPAPELPVTPRQGYRIEIYHDEEHGVRMPVLAAAVSRERLFELFLDLLQPLGEVVDVVLETSHDSPVGEHEDRQREEIDLPVLLSNLCDFEDLLLHDGCTGIAVMSKFAPMEVQFDEHKTLVIYAEDLEPFERILLQAGIRRDDKLKLITEGEHLHSTDPAHADAFDQLSVRLGVEAPTESVTWWE